MAVRKMIGRQVSRYMTIFTSEAPLLNGDQSSDIDVSEYDSFNVQLFGTAGAGLNCNHRLSADGVNFNTALAATGSGWTNLGQSSIAFRGALFRSEVTAGDGTTSLLLNVVAWRSKP
jgi:hypothetical protein